MTKQEFINLPINKKSLAKLQNISSKGFRSMDNECFEGKYWVFFGESAQSIRTYLAYPKAIKKAIEKPTMEGYLKSMHDIKEMGYRKELSLPF